MPAWLSEETMISRSSMWSNPLVRDLVLPIDDTGVQPSLTTMSVMSVRSSSTTDPSVIDQLL
jgi:hypothetical protein